MQLREVVWSMDWKTGDRKIKKGQVPRNLAEMRGCSRGSKGPREPICPSILKNFYQSSALSCIYYSRG